MRRILTISIASIALQVNGFVTPSCQVGQRRSWTVTTNTGEKNRLLPNQSSRPPRCDPTTILFESNDSVLSQESLIRDVESAVQQQEKLTRAIAQYNEQVRQARTQLDRLEEASVQNQRNLNLYQEQAQAFMELQAKRNEARQQLLATERQMRATKAQILNNNKNDSLELPPILNEDVVLPSLTGLTFLAAVRSVLQMRPEVRKEQSTQKPQPSLKPTTKQQQKPLKPTPPKIPKTIVQAPRKVIKTQPAVRKDLSITKPQPLKATTKQQQKPLKPTPPKVPKTIVQAPRKVLKTQPATTSQGVSPRVVALVAGLAFTLGYAPSVLVPPQSFQESNTQLQSLRSTAINQQVAAIVDRSSLQKNQDLSDLTPRAKRLKRVANSQIDKMNDSTVDNESSEDPAPSPREKRLARASKRQQQRMAKNPAFSSSSSSSSEMNEIAQRVVAAEPDTMQTSFAVVVSEAGESNDSKQARPASDALDETKKLLSDETEETEQAPNRQKDAFASKMIAGKDLSEQIANVFGLNMPRDAPSVPEAEDTSPPDSEIALAASRQSDDFGSTVIIGNDQTAQKANTFGLSLQKDETSVPATTPPVSRQEEINVNSPSNDNKQARRKEPRILPWRKTSGQQIVADSVLDSSTVDNQVFEESLEDKTPPQSPREKLLARASMRQQRIGKNPDSSVLNELSQSETTVVAQPDALQTPTSSAVVGSDSSTEGGSKDLKQTLTASAKEQLKESDQLFDESKSASSSDSDNEGVPRKENESLGTKMIPGKTLKEQIANAFGMNVPTEMANGLDNQSSNDQADEVNIPEVTEAYENDGNTRKTLKKMRKEKSSLPKAIVDDVGKLNEKPNLNEEALTNGNAQTSETSKNSPDSNDATPLNSEEKLFEKLTALVEAKIESVSPQSKQVQTEKVQSEVAQSEEPQTEVAQSEKSSITADLERTTLRDDETSTAKNVFDDFVLPEIMAKYSNEAARTINAIGEANDPKVTASASAIVVGAIIGSVALSANDDALENSDGSKNITATQNGNVTAEFMKTFDAPEENPMAGTTTREVTMSSSNPNGGRDSNANGELSEYRPELYMAPLDCTTVDTVEQNETSSSRRDTIVYSTAANLDKDSPQVGQTVSTDLDEYPEQDEGAGKTMAETHSSSEDSVSDCMSMSNSSSATDNVIRSNVPNPNQVSRKPFSDEEAAASLDVSNAETDDFDPKQSSTKDDSKDLSNDQSTPQPADLYDVASKLSKEFDEKRK